MQKERDLCVLCDIKSFCENERNINIQFEKSELFSIIEILFRFNLNFGVEKELSVRFWDWDCVWAVKSETTKIGRFHIYLQATTS